MKIFSEIAKQASDFLADDDDDGRPSAGSRVTAEVKSKVEALQKDKAFAAINTEKLQSAVADCLTGDFSTLAMLCVRPLLNAILPALGIALLVVVALFFVKWWLGLIGIILYIPFVIVKVFLEVKRMAAKLGFSAMRVIKEMISDIF